MTYYGGFYDGIYTERSEEGGGINIFSFLCQIPFGGFGGPEKDLGHLKWS